MAALMAPTRARMANQRARPVRAGRGQIHGAAEQIELAPKAGQRRQARQGKHEDGDRAGDHGLRAGQSGELIDIVDVAPLTAEIG